MCPPRIALASSGAKPEGHPQWEWLTVVHVCRCAGWMIWRTSSGARVLRRILVQTMGCLGPRLSMVCQLAMPRETGCCSCCREAAVPNLEVCVCTFGLCISPVSHFAAACKAMHAQTCTNMRGTRTHTHTHTHTCAQPCTDTDMQGTQIHHLCYFRKYTPKHSPRTMHRCPCEPVYACVYLLESVDVCA